MASCSKENINLFFKYLRGQLSRKEECLIDAHLQDCKHCLLNFAYVEEIIMHKHKLSIDEQTLLLRYISDPICQQQLDKLKQDILADITDIQKQEIKQQILNQLNTLSSNNAASSTIKPEKSRSMANVSNQRSLFINKYINVIFTVIFLGLSTSLYLLLSKNGLLFSSSDFLSSTPSKNAIDDTHHKLTNNISVTTNLYQDLDLAIDKYLERQDPTLIKQAESIAKAIERKYDDKYGVDLVAYYTSVEPSKLDSLSSYRKEMFELINQPIGDNYENSLKRCKKLEREFFQLDDKIEAYRVKTLTNKSYTMLYNYELSQTLTQDGLNFSKTNQYLFLQGYFLLWQAKGLSETSSFEESEKLFQQTISIGKKIQLDDLIIISKVSLSALYHLNNENRKCLEITQSLLSNTNGMRKTRIITLLQIAGLAATSLKYDNLAKEYLEGSLKLAQEIKNPSFIARSSMFLSLASAEIKDFTNSSKYYLKTIETIAEITDEKTRLETLYISLGYQGKIKLLEGDFYQASDTYKQALVIMQQLGVQNNLQLSQINQALALASKELKNPEETAQYLASANHYAKLAANNKEKANCLLSFIPNACYLE